jgi:hypothetical protein
MSHQAAPAKKPVARLFGFLHHGRRATEQQWRTTPL